MELKEEPVAVGWANPKSIARAEVSEIPAQHTSIYEGNFLL